jgi:hypothetical protein
MPVTSYFCSFTVHTGAGLIVPEIQDDGQVCNFGHYVLQLHDLWPWRCFLGIK